MKLFSIEQRIFFIIICYALVVALCLNLLYRNGLEYASPSTHQHQQQVNNIREFYNKSSKDSNSVDANSQQLSKIQQSLTVAHPYRNIVSNIMETFDSSKNNSNNTKVLYATDVRAVVRSKFDNVSVGSNGTSKVYPFDKYLSTHQSHSSLMLKNIGKQDLSRSSKFPSSKEAGFKRTSALEATVLPVAHNNNVITVAVSGNFTSRLQQFNEFLTTFRSHDLITQIKAKKQRLNISGMKKKCLINGDDYLSELSDFKQVVTLALPWTIVNITNDTKLENPNMLIEEYYPWVAQIELCNLLRKNSILPDVYIKVFRGMFCTHGPKKATLSQSLNYGHMKAQSGRKFSQSFYDSPPTNLLHVHVIKTKAVITVLGCVISNGLKMIPDYCGRYDILKSKESVKPSVNAKIPKYNEVFTISHPPGGAYYHILLEEIPRIAPFLSFLNSHPQIKIHCSRAPISQQLVSILGIDKSRLISGLVMANVVYVPRLPFCMLPRVTETQVLSSLYHNYIRKNFPTEPRNRLVLIMRSEKRKFHEPSQIELVVAKVAQRFHLRYTVFRDDPVPSLNDTMRIFNSAVMVVAAHGAGLSNVIFSEPRTIVIEAVPYSKLTPLCYLQIAHILGQHWHGMLSRAGRFEVITLDPDSLKNMMKKYLKTMNVQA